MTNIHHADFFHWPETQTLCRVFQRAGEDVRVVGGAVRDALMGRKVVDVDFCTPLLPEQVMDICRDAGIRTIPTGIDHGTITALIGKRHFEITTLRRDVACDGRHAEVAFATDYAEDASRRDFTINALSADTTGRVYDYHGGTADIEAKTMRFIGDAPMRIREDALRILRLFRFQGELGFKLDAGAVEAARSGANLLKPISRERKQQELMKLLACTNPEPAWRSMHQAAVLDVLFTCPLAGSLAALVKAEAALACMPDALVRLAFALTSKPAADARALASDMQQSFALSKHFEKALAALLAHAYSITPDMSLAACRSLQRKLGTECFLQVLLLNAARNSQAMDYFQAEMQAARAWELPQFPVNGTDLLALGQVSGKELGAKLAALEAAWEASGYHLSKEELLKNQSNL